MSVILFQGIFENNNTFSLHRRVRFFLNRNHGKQASLKNKEDHCDPLYKIIIEIKFSVSSLSQIL